MTYTCAHCHETFESDRPDEEAAAEKEAVFGTPHTADDLTVCDDCYQRMVKRYPPEMYRKGFPMPDCN